jgi:cation transport ATPase
LRLEDIHLVHSLPGRIRFKLEGMKGKPDQAREIETGLAAVQGMHSVQASYVTGSVVARYDPSVLVSLDLHFAIARALGIPPSNLNAEYLAKWSAEETNGVSSSTITMESIQNWRMLVPLTLCLFGVRSALVTDKLAFPQWYDYLWFAFGTYFALNPSEAETHEEIRRQA